MVCEDYHDQFVAESGNRYALLFKTLGRGNKSQVRVGVDIGRQSKVAVKLTERCEDNYPKMRREQELLIKIQGHKNVVKFYDYAELPDDIALVFEQYPMTLFDFVQENGHLSADLSEEECSRIFRELVGAMKYLRNKNISHLDLKLENVMMDENRSPVLIDFGFAEETEPGQTLLRARGSTNYVSPEIVRKLPYDPEKADVWSLGVILFAMATGVLPFRHASSVLKTLERIQTGAYELPATVPASVADLISHLLVVDPAERYSLAQILEHPFIETPAIESE